MLPVPHRLRRSADFTTVLRSRTTRRSGGSLIVLHGLANPERRGMPCRAGLVVSRGVGGAVVRNRVKRRLREQLRARLTRLPEGFDLVVRSTPAAADASSSQLGAALDIGLARILPAPRAVDSRSAGSPQ